MVWSDFVLRLVLAFILGAGIGIERQWTKTRSVLKINVLVSLGAAMFVMMAAMTPGDSSPTRVAAQVVSGIGFLGGGVILRDGRSVRGINTAATLWCAGAIGSLVGSGFFIPAYFGTLAVIGANLMLRPVVQIFHLQLEESEEKAIEQNAITLDSSTHLNPTSSLALPDSSNNNGYRCRLNCEPKTETDTLALLVQLVRERGLNLVAMQSENVSDENQESIAIEVEFWSNNNELELLAKLIDALKQRGNVQIASWELLLSEK